MLPRCGSASLAEDLVSETFLAAVTASRQGTLPEVNVAWLVGVARHKRVDHWRRLEREQRSLAAAESWVADALSRGDLRLVLSAPGGQNVGGGSTLPDGRTPEPGGWNRFAVEVADLGATVERLRHAGVRFRSDIIQGVGGNQALAEDPSGNPIELFQPLRPEARLTPST